VRIWQSPLQSEDDILDQRQLEPSEGGGDPMNNFSYSINIRQFQNLLETSVDEAERETIQRLLIEEKAKAALQASEPQKK
jgi:hypothetical protein